MPRAPLYALLLALTPALLRAQQPRADLIVTNANIYAPVMMVAEKAADLIRGQTPLTPEPLPFFRVASRMLDHPPTIART